MSTTRGFSSSLKLQWSIDYIMMKTDVLISSLTRYLVKLITKIQMQTNL